MTLRPFTRRSMLAATGLLAVQTATRKASAQTQARPNVMWLVSEDNAPLIGAYGDPLARTPHIDALAKRGILYKNAYCPAPVCAPTRFTILTGVQSQSCAPAHHMRARGAAAGILPTYPELMRAAGYYCTNNANTDYNCDIDPAKVWDASSKTAHWKNRAAGQPFMAVFNSETTHEMQLFRPQPGAITPEQVRVPAYLPDTPGIRQDIAGYYNLIEKMDGEIGARLDELDRAGLSDDTIIFYYSDNGGVLPRSKRYCHDEGMRCALIVSIPPKWQHLVSQPMGSVVDDPVSFVDLAPTLLSLADIPRPGTMQGRALLGKAATAPQPYAFGMRGRMDANTDMVRTATDGRYRYIRNYMPHLPLVQYQAFSWMMRSYQDWERAYRAGQLNAAQRRAFEPRVFEEFYDVATDRDQITNLIDDPAHKSRIAVMRRALDREMLRVNDNGFIPEGSRLEGYVPSRAKGAYPLRKIMALAQAAARRDPRKLKAFTTALASPNEVVRYWGAMGLLMLGPKVQGRVDALSATVKGDRSPHVRIVAAEAIAMQGQATDSVAVLADYCGRQHPVPVRLQAVNALSRLGDAAKAARPQVEAMAKERTDMLYNVSTWLLQQWDGTYDPGKPIFDMESMMSGARTIGVTS